MPKCPYCKNEIEFKVEIKPAPINDKFKSDLIQTYQSFIEIQAEVVPFGGKMIKRMANYSLKFVERYLDLIGAIPLIVQSCSNCDSVITAEPLVDLMSSKGSGSS
ncbi:MAG: hypothetical protein R3255_08660 [Candidatus Lokiarchaeia archaeon]|nr:hypothetical protein [Candidatus Lokiarchaeia archaeon]